jgi:DNA-binding IclR family transcriptional regulator
MDAQPRPTQIGDQSMDVGAAPGPTCPNSMLGKTFSILSAFDEAPETLRLIDMVQRSGVPKPSVYRLAQELVELGLLERVGSAYRLGFGMFALGQRVGTGKSLRSAARPILVDLCAATRATLHLAVLENNRTFYLEKLGGTRSVHVLSRVGGRLPLTCTASGKLLLAMSPRREQYLTEIAENNSLVRDQLTSRSTASVAALRHELQLIAERRYAVEREETLVGFKSYAVPVVDQAGMVIAALSATIPVAREDDHELLRHLRLAAAAISRQYASRVTGYGAGALAGHRQTRLLADAV